MLCIEIYKKLQTQGGVTFSKAGAPLAKAITSYILGVTKKQFWFY